MFFAPEEEKLKSAERPSAFPKFYDVTIKIFHLILSQQLLQYFNIKKHLNIILKNIFSI